MGLDPFTFAVVVCINIIVGGVTPPVGVLLYVSSSIAQTTLEDASRYVLPSSLCSSHRVRDGLRSKPGDILAPASPAIDGATVWPGEHTWEK